MSDVLKRVKRAILAGNCGEEIYDREAMRIIDEHSPAFAKSTKQ